MRLASGFYKGMSIVAPTGLATRPTSAKVRESAMNLLRDYLEGCCWLDLFAGSGAVGIEALSRGAEHCTFVDSDQAAMRALRENLSELNRRAKKNGSSASVRALKSDVASLNLSGGPSQFDVIWADPPYAQLEALAPVLGRLAKENLSGHGVLGLETSSQDLEMVTRLFPEFLMVKQKKYGDTGLSIMEINSGESPS